MQKVQPSVKGEMCVAFRHSNLEITSQRLLDQTGHTHIGEEPHIPPHFGPILVPYHNGLVKSLLCVMNTFPNEFVSSPAKPPHVKPTFLKV